MTLGLVWCAVRYGWRLVGWLLTIFYFKKFLLIVGFVYALYFVFVNFVGWSVHVCDPLLIILMACVCICFIYGCHVTYLYGLFVCYFILAGREEDFRERDGEEDKLCFWKWNGFYLNHVYICSICAYKAVCVSV